MTKRLPNPCECDRLHIWTDGQVFGKPGAWDGYYTMVIDDGGAPLSSGELHGYVGIGNKTVNECEYSGVIAALEWAKANRERVHIITDSDLIRGHLKDGYRCAQSLVRYKDRVAELVDITGARIEWMGRDFNKAGWYNAGVLLERARNKRIRDKERGIVRRKKPKPNKALQHERRRWAYQARQDDD